MTLDDLEKIEREFLVPNDVAQILGCDPYNINVQARKDQMNGTKSFPFPVIMIGNRVKIPKRAFLEVMKHGTAV